jgi:hypothetical protein
MERNWLAPECFEGLVETLGGLATAEEFCVLEHELRKVGKLADLGFPQTLT